MTYSRDLTPSEAEVDRFWGKVDRDGADDCWLWTAAVDGCGYGMFWIGQRRAIYRSMRAHRLAYELLIGEIPQGLTLDHLCMRTACVNPAHLEPVTRSENSRRSWLVRPPRPSHPINHGTYGGYARHRARGEEACAECKAAKSAAQMRWMRSRAS